jgi:DNA-binding beta-propeller fold protein YncE
MSTLRTLALLAVCSLAQAAEVKYDFVPNFLGTPPGKAQIGNGHGEIAVDSAGNIYVSVQDKDAGLQVYGKDGKYVKTLALPNSLHGFVIRKTDDGEFIFAAVLNEQRFIKCTLDGKVVLEIKKDAFPAEQAKPGLKLTNCDVAPNGDIYIVDGYGKSWVFVFDKTGAFKKVFGGPTQIVDGKGFANTHKIFVDTRFAPARLLCLDRGNNRMFHVDLDGTNPQMISNKGLRNPSSASFHGDLMCVAEIAGRVSVWNKEGAMVASMGANDTKGQTNTPKVAPADWREGVVTSPHGITFDGQGNILETEWNVFGRVLRWDRK